MPPRLELRNISKSYPGVVANDSISLSLNPGEIHAVLGENGAGKSTLMKIIYGAASPDGGEMLWDNQRLGSHTPSSARLLGIEMVYQHFALFETISVVENVALVMRDAFDLKILSRRLKQISERYSLPIEPDRLVHDLSMGERQRVEIVRCLIQNPKLLILDEPTSVLPPQAVANLFKTLRQVASEGCAILYISHKLHEVQELCRAATVLRGGRVAGRIDPQATSAGDIATLMVGAAVPETHRAPSRRAATPSLDVRRLSRKPDDPFGVTLEDLSVSVFGGEIVGIAGISGNGQAELVRALSGEVATPDADAIRICGESAGQLSAAERRRLGFAFVPEERLGRGAVPPHSLRENALLTGYMTGMVKWGLVRARRARDRAEAIIAHYGVKATGPEQAAQNLSGGNLQKFVVGREIELTPRVLLVSQPTWGVDIGAAAFIRQKLIDLSRAGAAVLVLSEELDELFEICDRLLVLHAGRLSPPLDRAAATVEEIGLLMTGRAGAKSICADGQQHAFQN